MMGTYRNMSKLLPKSCRLTLVKTLGKVLFPSPVPSLHSAVFSLFRFNSQFNPAEPSWK